jgi:hypothetical protein
VSIDNSKIQINPRNESSDQEDSLPLQHSGCEQRREIGCERLVRRFQKYGKETNNKYMNQYEIYQLFETTDVDKDGLVSEKEWQNFYRVFLVPFRDQCDLSTNYLLNVSEFKSCMIKVKSLK